MMLLRPAPQLGHVAMATAELAATQRRPVRRHFGLRLCLRSQRGRHHVCSDEGLGLGGGAGGGHHPHHHGEHDFFLLRTHRLFFCRVRAVGKAVSKRCSVERSRMSLYFERGRAK